MTITPVAEGDEVVDDGGRPLLIVDAEIVGKVDGAILDLTRSEGGREPRLELREPPRPAPANWGSPLCRLAARGNGDALLRPPGGAWVPGPFGPASC